MTEPRSYFQTLEIQGLGKSFGSLRALDDVSCSLRRGEVHAILGENGAGKSTLASILTGFLRPGAGSIVFDSDPQRPIPYGYPGRLRKMGVELVHQHFTLVPDLTVAENLALSQIPKLGSRLDVESWAYPALEAGRELGWTFHPAQKVAELSVGEQQRLEIVRVLGNDPHLVVFDEPTAVLAQEEAGDLLRVILALRDRGKAIVLIAHKLSEVMAVADRVTVLRKGLKVAEAGRGEFDARLLAEWMVGEIPRFEEGGPSSTQPGLSVRALSVKGDPGHLAVSQVSLEIERGAIVGIGGVDGNGQLELAEALAGVRPVESGSLLWEGREMPQDLEIGFIPQDRRRDGIIPDANVLDNLMLSGIRRESFLAGPFIRGKETRNWAKDLIQRFSIKADSPNDIVGRLSGGNQQKVVVSRNLDRLPNLLVACNPTRGLDVKAAEFVHRQLRRAKTEGTAVLLISSDLDELRELADRTYFLSRGKIAEGTSAVSFVGGE